MTVVLVCPDVIFTHLTKCIHVDPPQMGDDMKVAEESERRYEKGMELEKRKHKADEG